VERRRDETDRRIAHLHPTARALAAWRARERSWGNHMKEVLDRLGADDTAALLDAVGVLVRLAADLGGEMDRT
jgi:DNA-binding MarR family transcriptional regulator